ncbi:MAG: hypothetical protein RLZZ362_703 [Actinomycetota bacterium]|jgi:two-component system CheB/CheR fusion protein
MMGVMGSGIEAVLDHLKRTRAFDFTGYRRATLTRRIDKRMQQVGVDDYERYVDYLEVHPEEFSALLDTILINVSAFFRDQDAWDALRGRLVDELLPARPYGPIRVWSAGCASGREAYSAVMLFAEIIGIEATKERLKVYATDVDELALDQARQAVYSEREMEGVPHELIGRYFERTPSGLAFRNDLRRIVIFGRHDLLQDAPISRVDLLLCRNTLMYFNTDVQAQLIERLHFSLADDGLLMLGRAEMLLSHGHLFQPVDIKHRIFRKVPRSTMRSRLLSITGARRLSPEEDTDEPRAIELGFERRPTSEVLIDGAGVVIGVNAMARATFGLAAEVVGRPFQDLQVSYRPVELRSYIDEAQASGQAVHIEDVDWATAEGSTCYLDINIVPLVVPDGGPLLGFMLSFTDVTAQRTVRDELEHTHHELETAYEELQSTNEELETTNEELQSTVEELETTNEELQSTNEELETMNEELSSTNEELHAMNLELSERTSEVGRINAYMESVFASLQASVVVVDRDLHVRVWDGMSFELWGLRSDEVEGRSFLALDIGFPVAQLGPAIHACLRGGEHSAPLVTAAVNRRGHPITCTARVSPLHGSSGDLEGAIILVEQERPDPDS